MVDGKFQTVLWLRWRFLVMKPGLLALAVGLCLSLPAVAAFEFWTSKDGRKAELEFMGKTEKDGAPAAQFRLRNGQTTVLKVSDLDEASQAKLEKLLESAPASAAAPGGAAPAAPSVFDKQLERNLVRLSGNSVRRAADVAKPAKYYVFYYSASWCGPCQQYTPSLVELYNKIKPNNPNFELVFVSRDQDEDSMEEYMKEKKMPWPALKLSAVEKFQKEFNHGVNGIPSVIVCDLEGKVVSRTNGTAQLEELLGAK